MNATTLTRRDLLASLALAGPGWVAAQGNSSSAPGDARAPALPRPGAALALADLPLLDGSMFRASAADGQVLVVYWWASWCPSSTRPRTPTTGTSRRTRRSLGLNLHLLGIARPLRLSYARRQSATLRGGHRFRPGSRPGAGLTGFPGTESPEGLVVQVQDIPEVQASSPVADSTRTVQRAVADDLAIVDRQARILHRF